LSSVYVVPPKYLSSLGSPLVNRAYEHTMVMTMETWALLGTVLTLCATRQGRLQP
jgi:hypothetical protein